MKWHILHRTLICLLVGYAVIFYLIMCKVSWCVHTKF